MSEKEIYRLYGILEELERSKNKNADRIAALRKAIFILENLK